MGSGNALCGIVLKLWNSTQAGRGSNEIGSCILQILRRLPPSVKEVVIWADTCGWQNRNKENAALIMHFLNEEKKRDEL